MARYMDLIDVKVLHYLSHGVDRCVYLESDRPELENFGYAGFCHKIQHEIPAFSAVDTHVQGRSTMPHCPSGSKSSSNLGYLYTLKC